MRLRVRVRQVFSRSGGKLLATIEPDRVVTREPERDIQVERTPNPEHAGAIAERVVEQARRRRHD